MSRSNLKYTRNSVYGAKKARVLHHKHTLREITRAAIIIRVPKTHNARIHLKYTREYYCVAHTRKCFAVFAELCSTSPMGAAQTAQFPN
jgi:hypothetical protein